MTQIPILSGIVGRSTPDFYKSHPLNMVPVVESGDGSGSGISKGYLRSPAGIATKATIANADRGGYVWKGKHYRVIGTKLAMMLDDGTIVPVGDVGTGGPVTWAESFDRLAINSGAALWYYSGTALTQVTDADLGPVLSLAWSDGYFITTDGTSIVITELNDPTSIDPLKYGSSEAVPDPISGLLALRGEVYALNRYSIEVFSNRGTTGFPFARNRGAEIGKGCVGPNAFSPFVETFAFVGSGRNETCAVYLAGSGQAIKISPRAMDDELSRLTADELAGIEVEQRNSSGQLELLVHLPRQTWVYGWVSSQQLDQPVWYRLASGVSADAGYEPRHFTLFNGRWWAGSQVKIGVVDDAIATVFDTAPRYAFDTLFIYNGGMGAILHSLELVAMAGRSGDTSAPVMMSYTNDGSTYSQQRPSRTGARGNRSARPAWRQCGLVRNWRGYRFEGRLTDPVAFARLEAQIEGLGGAA